MFEGCTGAVHARLEAAKRYICSLLPILDGQENNHCNGEGREYGLAAIQVLEHRVGEDFPY